jgi:threonine dehydrogenase-like Zn-dependent dehydrogenase
MRHPAISPSQMCKCRRSALSMLRIKIHQSGVCGTDLHLHHGTYIGAYPLTPGHETIGEIDEVGSEVSRFHPGERVTVNPNIYCGRCAHVIGAGPTGLLLAQLIGSGGAPSVTVGDIVPFKLQTARNLGVDSTVLMTTDPAENIDLLRKASPSGDGMTSLSRPPVYRLSGNICLPLTRNGGTVLVYGVTRPDERLSVSPFEIFRREITIKGSYAEMTSFGAAIAALRTGRVRTDGIISHRFSLDDYGKALETLASDPAAHKVVISL